MKLTTIIIIIVVVFTFGIWWSFYQYKDCLKVGHSILYCIGKFIGG